MKEISKFIPMEENGGAVGTTENAGATENENIGGSAFKVCGTNSNLPAKPSIWSKLKGFLTYEIKVELTPYEQQLEDEINEVLHQEVTWKSFKDFLFQDVVITRKNKVK